MHTSLISYQKDLHQIGLILTWCFTKTDWVDAYNVQAWKVLGQSPSTDNFQVAESFQIGEILMMRLYVQVSGDFMQGGQDFQFNRIHSRITGSKGKILINILVSIETWIQNGDWTF